MINKYLAMLCIVFSVSLMSCASLKSGQADFTLVHQNKVKFLSSFPPENRVAVFSGDGIITVWDITNGQMVREIDPDRSESAVFMVYSPYGVVVRYQGTNVLAVFPVTEGLVQSTTLGKSLKGDVIRNIVCSPDGKYIVYDVIDYNSTSDIDRDHDWNPTTGTSKMVETTTTSSKYSGKLHCVDVESNKWLFEIPLPYSSSVDVSTRIERDYGDLGSDSDTSRASYGRIISITSIAMDPQFETIACGFSDGTIRLYNTKTRILQEKFDAHGQAVTALTFGPKGAYLLSGDERGFLYQWKKNGDSSGWNNRSGQLRMNNRIVSITISPNGRAFIVKESSGVFRIFSFSNGKEIKSVKGGSLIDSVLFRPDNRMEALGIKGDFVFVWDLGSF
jgi:WD40 repeat protein